MASAAQQPLGIGKPRDGGTWPLKGAAKGKRDIAGLRTNQSTEKRATESAKKTAPWDSKPVAMEW